jgi:hypothetical protein
MRLSELLQTLRESEDALTGEWDLSTLIGDIKDKIDDTKFIHDKLKSELVWYDKQIDELKKRRTAIANNKKGLEAYLNWNLTQTDMTECPGNLWRLKLQNNPVKIEAKREPDIDDYMSHDNLVERKVSYSWKLNRIKEVIAKGALPDSLSQDLVPITDTHVRFYAKQKE